MSAQLNSDCRIRKVLVSVNSASGKLLLRLVKQTHQRTSQLGDLSCPISRRKPAETLFILATVTYGQRFIIWTHQQTIANISHHTASRLLSPGMTSSCWTRRQLSAHCRYCYWPSLSGLSFCASCAVCRSVYLSRRGQPWLAASLICRAWIPQGFAFCEPTGV
jgi:hypothetical protein